MIKSCLFLAIVLTASRTDAQSIFSHVPKSPELFAVGMISTPANERDFALSPDGNELFYTLQAPKAGTFQTIVRRTKNSNGKWSEPEIAPFAGNFTDLEPAFSADGKKLFFCSNRPVNGDQPKDFDIWFVEKINGRWSEAKNMGPIVNSALDEFYPSVAKNGNLYFTAAYKTAIGREDIFISRWQDGKYLPPVPLDSGVNSVAYEFNAFVSPEEDFIIFTSFGRKDDTGGGDLYISFKGKDGKWKAAQNLKLVNSVKMDYCPFVSFDKKIFFFTSERSEIKSVYKERTSYQQLVKSFNTALNGGGNIYWIDFSVLLKSVHVE